MAFVGRSAPADVVGAPWASEVEWVTFPLEYGYESPWNPLRVGAAQWLALPWMAARRRLDVVHGLANIVPIVRRASLRVVTLLDLIWLHFPTTMTRRATLTMRLTAPCPARARPIA